MSNLSPVVERVFDYMSEVRKGKLDLSWMESNPSGWGVKATPRDDRGLGLEDINRVGTYGDVPDRGSYDGSMAPRGSEIPPDMPSLDCYDRYQHNLQEFFDRSASLPTYFAESEQPHAP